MGDGPISNFHWKRIPAAASLAPYTARAAFRAVAWLAGASAALTIGMTAAVALEPEANEKNLLEACERRLCSQILDRKPSDGQLTCNLGKTWGSSDIEKGARKKSLSWGFGAARCKVNLGLARSEIVSALETARHEVRVPAHDVRCNVETDDGLKPLTARLEPKLQFKKGRVEKVWIGLRDIDGPEPLSSFVWTTAKLADNLGLFHSEMVSEINEFMHEKCAKRRDERIAKKRLKRQREKKAAAREKRRKARLARKEARKKARAEAKQKRAAQAAGGDAASKPASAPAAANETGATAKPNNEKPATEKAE